MILITVIMIMILFDYNHSVSNITKIQVNAKVQWAANACDCVVSYFFWSPVIKLVCIGNNRTSSALAGEPKSEIW